MDIIAKYKRRKIIIFLFCFLTFSVVLLWNTIFLLNLRLDGYTLTTQLGMLLIYLKPVLLSAIGCFSLNFIGTSICDHIILLEEIKNKCNT